MHYFLPMVQVVTLMILNVYHKANDGADNIASGTSYRGCALHVFKTASHKSCAFFSSALSFKHVYSNLSAGAVTFPPRRP